MTRAEVLEAARDIVRWTLTLKRGIVTRGPTLLLFYGWRYAGLHTPDIKQAAFLLFRRRTDGFFPARALVARRPRWPSYVAGNLRPEMERAADLRRANW